MAVDDSSPSSSSSSSSAESSFRELDDAFLQSQARIWLGEVLHTRFDEQISISDLLSDGELLFEVSQALWDMLLVKYMELSHVKAHMYIPVDTRKSSGRYRPYSNVDSFLKVCKVLGLDGVDLFSPSDVVEKRDTRKVCICIRSLSKKARSKKLNVPDFDIVTKTVAMPTDVVGCIRRSLELSTCSVTCSQSKDTRLKFRQKSSHASRRQKDESSFEESDEAKSSLSAIHSYSSYSDSSYTGALYLDFEESSEAISKYAPTEGVIQLESPCQETDKFAHLPGSRESILLPYVRNGSPLDSILSPVYKSQVILHENFTPLTQGQKVWHTNGELDQVGLGEIVPSLPNILPDNGVEVNQASYQFALSDMISFRILTSNPFHISEDCLCHSCIGTESHNSNSTPRTSMYSIWRQFSDDVEASSTSSSNSVIGRILDFDFDAESDLKDLQASISLTPYLQQREVEGLHKVPLINNESDGMAKHVEPLYTAVLAAEEPVFNIEHGKVLYAKSFSSLADGPESCSSVDQEFESLNNQKSPTQKDSGDSSTLVKNNNSTDDTDDTPELTARKGDSEKWIRCIKMADQKPERDCQLDFSRNVVDGTNKDSEGICNNRLAVESSERCQPCILKDVGRKGFGNMGEENGQISNVQIEDTDRDADNTNNAINKDERKENAINCLAEESCSDGRDHNGTGNLKKKANHVGPLLKTLAKGTALLGILFFLHLRTKSERGKRLQWPEQSSGSNKSTDMLSSTRRKRK